MNQKVRRTKHIERFKEVSKKSRDKNVNTFGRNGIKRGNFSSLRRDYELTEQQLNRRNKARKARHVKIPQTNERNINIL